MPKSDTWPGGIAMETVTGMDSAGSCDSVVSINSGFSEDSLEHLSAEEKACLMFLEETIEALEVEDDSGLSNDEPERMSHGLAGRTAHPRPLNHNKHEEISVHEDPNKVIGKDHKPAPSYLVPTPLLVASRNAMLVNRPAESSPQDKPVLIDAPDEFRSKSPHQQPALGVSEKAAPSKVVAAEPERGLSSDVSDLPPSFIPKPPVKTSLPSDSKSGSKTLSMEATSQRQHPNTSSEPGLGWIPPPSDFMDEPLDSTTIHQSYSPAPQPVVDEPPDWTPKLPKQENHPAGAANKPAEVKPNVDPETSSGSLSQDELENLRKKASKKKAPHLTPVMVAQHPAAEQHMTPSPSSEHVPGQKESCNLKSPPVVAPKPKKDFKLPSNIILKSHKDTGAANSLLPQSERSPLDPQKVRMEALRKLGLLKNDEVDSGPSVSPSQSPTFKTKDSSPSPSNSSTYTYTAAPTVEPVQDQSGLAGPPSPRDVQLKAETSRQRNVGSREGSFNLKKQLTKPGETKSGSLGRSGVGFSSIVIEPTPQATNLDKTNVELSPGQLRKSRPRPPSAGSAKDFDIEQQSDDSKNKSHAASVQPAQPVNDSQKLPRSNGISVLISPHAKNGENRREALRKLGLLRD